MTHAEEISPPGGENAGAITVTAPAIATARTAPGYPPASEFRHRFLDRIRDGRPRAAGRSACAAQATAGHYDQAAA